MSAKAGIKLTKEQQKLLAGAVLLFGVGGFAYVKWFWLPNASRIKDATEKLAKLQTDIAEAQRAAARIDKIQAELEDVRKRSKEVEKRLPTKKDIPGVIMNMARLAKKNKIDITSFAPGATKKEGLFEKPVYALSVKGTFHDLGRFFAAIALEERLYTVENVTYSPIGGEGVNMLMVNFILVSYVFKG